MTPAGVNVATLLVGISTVVISIIAAIISASWYLASNIVNHVHDDLYVRRSECELCHKNVAIVQENLTKEIRGMRDDLKELKKDMKIFNVNFMTYLTGGKDFVAE